MTDISKLFEEEEAKAVAEANSPDRIARDQEDALRRAERVEAAGNYQPDFVECDHCGGEFYGGEFYGGDMDGDHCSECAEELFGDDK